MHGLKNLRIGSGISLFLALFSFNIFAQESNLSQEKILEIQDKVNAMSSVQLSDRKAQLLQETEELNDEQDSTQSPARLKSISERLDAIFVELGIIEAALAIGLLSTVIDGDSDSRDITPPVITVLGSNPVTVERGDTYTDAGATADGGETVRTNLGGLNTNVVGTYTITYSASDASQNTGYATRTVNVVDTTNPVVTVTGDNPATVELGDTYTDAGATTTEGTVTSSGTVDTATVGTYSITYSATDDSGNVGTATRTVNVVDTTAPVVTVTSGTDTVELGATWTDAGATATDLSGTVTVVTSGTVDTDTVGTYTDTYT